MLRLLAGCFHYHVSGCAPINLCPWRSIPAEKVAAACADPTDAVVASNATTKVFSMVFLPMWWDFMAIRTPPVFGGPFSLIAST